LVRDPVFTNPNVQNMKKFLFACVLLFSTAFIVSAQSDKEDLERERKEIQDELKEKGLPWEKAKSWDNSAVIGKWIPLQSVKNKKDINFCVYKNRELVQKGNSGMMMNNFDYIVSYISNYFSVNIGDLIFTGTPDGVGECVVGDELEFFIEDESLGNLEIK